ncbi:MAG: hypothetical protein ACFFD4_21890 [Candidatus Odinarchaeota archaeon]
MTKHTELAVSFKTRLFVGIEFVKKHSLDFFTVSWLLLLWFVSSLGDMPSGTDTPIHFFKAYQTREFLQTGSWPGWTFLTQGGAPFLLTYPPLYYLLIAFLDFFINDTGFSMKIFALLTLMGLYLVFSKLSSSVSGQHNQISAAIFCLAVTVMYSMVGQHPFLLALFFALLSIYCYSFAFPDFSRPVDFESDRKRVFFLLVLSPVFFGLTVMTHLVAAYMLGVFWIILSLCQLYRKISGKNSLWNVIAPLHVAISGVLLAVFWFIPALIEYIYQDHYKVTILQQIFRQEDLMIIVALVSVSPLVLVTVFSSDGERKEQVLFLKVAVIFFLFIGLGKYSPFFFLPLFDSLLPGRVLVFVMIPASLLAIPGKKSSRLAFVLLLLISSATLIYYLNPAILGSSSIGTASWRNSGVAVMAHEGTLYGFIPDDFKAVLKELQKENDTTRVAYLAHYGSLSPLMQHIRILFLSGHSTVQGDYPDSSEDTKWKEFTSIVDYYYYAPNLVDYLALGNVGWVILKDLEDGYAISDLSNKFSFYSVHGEYEIWKSLEKPSEVNGIGGNINATVTRYEEQGRITIQINSCNCTSFVLSETFHPRWKGVDQEDQEVTITRNTFGFMNVSWKGGQGTIELTFRLPAGTFPALIVSIITLVALITIWAVWFREKLLETVQRLVRNHSGED